MSAIGFFLFLLHLFPFHFFSRKNVHSFNIHVSLSIFVLYVTIFIFQTFPQLFKALKSDSCYFLTPFSIFPLFNLYIPFWVTSRSHFSVFVLLDVIQSCLDYFLQRKCLIFVYIGRHACRHTFYNFHLPKKNFPATLERNKANLDIGKKFL